MLKHEKHLFHSVGVKRASTQYAVLLHEQLGGGNGELKAAKIYFNVSSPSPDNSFRATNANPPSFNNPNS